MKEEAVLFPDQFVHLGGDEVKYDCFHENLEFMNKLINISSTLPLATNAPLYWQYFWTTLLPIFNSILPGKRPIVWDEWQQEAANNYIGWSPVISVWRGTQNLHDATSQGYEVINMYGWYLNAAPEGGMTWGDFYNHHPYYYIPISSYLHSEISEQQQKLVLGGEAAAWELSEQCFHERAWEKLIAFSERMWSNPPYDEFMGVPMYGSDPCANRKTGDNFVLGSTYMPPTRSLLNKRFNEHYLRVWQRHNLDQWYHEVFQGEACGCAESETNSTFKGY